MYFVNDSTAKKSTKIAPPMTLYGPTTDTVRDAGATACVSYFFELYRANISKESYITAQICGTRPPLGREACAAPEHSGIYNLPPQLVLNDNIADDGFLSPISHI